MKKIVFVMVLLFSLNAFAQEADSAEKKQIVVPTVQEQNAAIADSIKYYQEQVDRYTASGTIKVSRGRKLMLAGGIAMALGLGSFAYSLADGNLSGDGMFFLAGYTTALGGLGVFTAGFITWYIGSSRMDSADEYQQKLNRIKERDSKISLQLVPSFDVQSKSLGGTLALNF